MTIDRMASTHRRKLLSECASGERSMESDVIARIALDEIDELDTRIESLVKTTFEINLEKRKGSVK